MRKLLLIWTVVGVSCGAGYLTSSSGTLAASTLLSRNQPNSSGVSIVAGGWNQATHSDSTYRQFKAIHTGPLGRYDFYYRLEIVPQFRMRFNDCASNPNVVSFFRSLFGVSRGALVAVKANIQQRWTSGTSIDLLKSDAMLAVAAIGSSSSSATAGNGCFFDQTLRPTLPWIQWNGGDANDDFDDFQIKFNVIGGKTEKLNAIANVVSLFGEVSAAAGWNYVTAGLATPASQAAQRAASSFQAALQEAGTLQNQVSKAYTLKSFFPDGDDSNGRIVITIPGLFGGDAEDNGNLAIYVRRQGSIILQGSGPLTPDSVFDTVELAYRQCSITEIASGTCDAKDNSTIRLVLAKALKGIKDSGLDETNPIQLLIDLKNRPKTVYDICKGIRTVSRLQLHLSTLDEMAIRWAFAKEGGLLAALDEADRNAAAANGLAQTTGHSVAELHNMCWNSDDQRILETVARNVGRPLQ